MYNIQCHVTVFTAAVRVAKQHGAQTTPLPQVAQTISTHHRRYLVEEESGGAE